MHCSTQGYILWKWRLHFVCHHGDMFHINQTIIQYSDHIYHMFMKNQSCATFIILMCLVDTVYYFFSTSLYVTPLSLLKIIIPFYVLNYFIFLSGSEAKVWCVLLPYHRGKGNYSLGNAWSWKHICFKSEHWYFRLLVKNIVADCIGWFVTYVWCLQAENNMEYVIEAHDTDDMRSWLATIKYCMRTMVPNQDGRLVATGAVLCNQGYDVWMVDEKNWIT